MDHSYPCLRLDVIITPAADIMRLWRTFCPVDCAFLRLIIGDLPLLADSPIDWTLLRTTISLWDTQHAVFNFQGTELAPIVEEYEALIQRPMPTRDIVVPNQYARIQSRLAVVLGLRGEEIRRELQYGWEHGIMTEWLIDFIDFIHIRALRATVESYHRDACHKFILLIFGTILFPSASNLIDGAQVVLQVVGGHSYVEAVLAETVRSLDYSESSDNLAAYRIFPPKRTALIIGSCGQDIPAEIMTMFQDQNRASSSFTPPPEHRATVDSNPMVPPIYVSESEDVSFSAMTHVPAVHPINDPLPPPLAPTYVPLPSAAFLFADFAVHASPPLAMSAQHPVYIVLPPTVPSMMSAPAPAHTTEPFPFQVSQPYMDLSYQAPPLLNIPPLEPGTPSQAAHAAPLTNFLPEAETQEDKRLKKMEETIKALQAGSSRFDYDDQNWNFFPGLPLPPKIKIPDFERHDGTKDPRHHLRHYQSKMLPYWDYEEFVIQTFQDSLMGSALDWFMTLKADLIEAGKKLDTGVKMGRIDGPSRKKDKETSKKQTAGTSRRDKDTTIGTVNSGRQTSQPISVDYTPAPQTSQAYAHPEHYTQLYLAQHAYSPAIPTVIQSPPPQQYAPAQAQQGRSPTSRSPQPAQRAPVPRTQQGNAAQSRPRKQYTTIPALPSHIFRQLLAGNKIKTEAPGPNFDPTVPAKEPYQDHQVPRNYGGEVANTEQETNAMGITRSGRIYQGLEPADKGKAPAASFSAVPEAASLPTKKVTKQEAKAFMKVIKASEYKVVEQMGKSPAHISLLALLLSSEPHRDALLKVLTVAQVPKETAPDRIEEIVNSIFSNQISFAEDELPSEGQGHLRALHIVCKCNNHVVGQVMIDNGSALNICPVSTLKQMNVDMSRIRASKTTAQAFDGFRREVNGEIDLLIDMGPCSFSVTFQILEIPNAFSLLLGRPWIHAAGVVPSSLHQKLKFFVEGKLITVNGEEDYAIYKEIVVLYVMGGTSGSPSTELDDSSSDTAEAFLALPAIYAVTEETSSKVDARFLEVCNYSEWVANIVPVEKKNRKVRVCIDYRDLNRASPKDNFSLPHIDVLVDNTIQMDEEDKIKTTFITMWGPFCYKGMPFDLKNAEATYQRAMIALFHDMMHKEIEVYVNDMIAKSNEGEGFVVSEKGIEVDPDKVKAIMELLPPSTVREVRSFLGRLNYIARFIANLTDKCQPLFHLLRKNAAVEWDDECQKAFDTIKAAIDLKVKELEVFDDSMLTIFQTLKQWKTKDPKLVPYHEYHEELIENFENISFIYTTRMKNQFADALATLASIMSITKENLIEPLEFEIAKGPAHCDMIEAVDCKPWYGDIKHLLQTGQFPAFTDRHDRRTL
ncbi:hypothetical protein CRG98_038122 [Punica granatum]|uniref:Uncharacterized protein n=1 Tax=Punica granatum TaxID=22663 RepID=A0A2I0IBV6_PUNGR|nr:hypothetical protein CRG98_038122 [Punica granatum]